MYSLCSVTKRLFRIDVIEEPGEKRYWKDENQGPAKNSKNRHIGSKGLFRSNVSLLKTQHHQRMKHNTIKQSLKYHYMAN